MKASVHATLLAVLVALASCNSASTPPLPDTPEAVADALLRHLQDGDCEAAVSLSTPWMWDLAPTVAEARVVCDAMLDAMPGITRFRHLGTYQDEDADPLLALPDARVVFEVEFADGSSADWGLNLGREPTGWIAIMLFSDYSYPRATSGTSASGFDRGRCLDVPVDLWLDLVADPVSGDSVIGLVQGAEAVGSTSVAPDGGPIWVLVIRAGARDWAFSHDGVSLETPGTWGALDDDAARVTGLPTGTATANATIEGATVAAACLSDGLGPIP